MKTLATFLFGCFVAAPLFAFKQSSNVVTFSDEEMQICNAGGGCRVITNADLNRLVKAFISCGVPT